MAVIDFIKTPNMVQKANRKLDFVKLSKSPEQIYEEDRKKLEEEKKELESQKRIFEEAKITLEDSVNQPKKRGRKPKVRDAFSGDSE